MDKFISCDITLNFDTIKGKSNAQDGSQKVGRQSAFARFAKDESNCKNTVTFSSFSQAKFKVGDQSANRALAVLNY